MKPPDNDPPAVTQAAERITLGEDGLEKEQVVSVGRKPEPLTETTDPTLPLPELKEIAGADETLGRIPHPAETIKTHRKSRVTVNLKDIQNTLSRR